MWLPEIFNLHMWLALYFYWTVLPGGTNAGEQGMETLESPNTAYD